MGHAFLSISLHFHCVHTCINIRTGIHSNITKWGRVRNEHHEKNGLTIKWNLCTGLDTSHSAAVSYRGILYINSKHIQIRYNEINLSLRHIHHIQYTKLHVPSGPSVWHIQLEPPCQPTAKDLLHATQGALVNVLTRLADRTMTSGFRSRCLFRILASSMTFFLQQSGSQSRVSSVFGEPGI